jgi:hypothetical protein
MPTWTHCLIWLIVGIIIAYYWPVIGDQTVGRLVPKNVLQ